MEQGSPEWVPTSALWALLSCLPIPGPSTQLLVYVGSPCLTSGSSWTLTTGLQFTPSFGQRLSPISNCLQLFWEGGIQTLGVHILLGLEWSVRLG